MSIKRINPRKVQHNHPIVPIELLNDEHICNMMFIAGYLGAELMGISLGIIGGRGSILTVLILVFLFMLLMGGFVIKQLFLH